MKGKNQVGFIFLRSCDILKMYGNGLDLETLVWTHVCRNIETDGGIWKYRYVYIHWVVYTEIFLYSERV